MQGGSPWKYRCAGVYFPSELCYNFCKDTEVKTMRLGFAKREITPPRGIVLGGYAGFRPCGGVHDPLYCKAVVLEQGMERYCLVTLDLLCVDEALYGRVA